MVYSCGGFFRRDSGAKSAIRENRKAWKSIGSLCINVSMEKLASPQWHKVRETNTLLRLKTPLTQGLRGTRIWMVPTETLKRFQMKLLFLTSLDTIYSVYSPVLGRHKRGQDINHDLTWRKCFVYSRAIVKYILEYWFQVESGKNLNQLL